MLDAGGKPRRAVRTLLIPGHCGGGHAAREQNVLAIGFGAAAPPRVARDIGHRGERDVQALRGSGLGGALREPPHQLRGEGARLCQRHRLCRGVSGGHVAHEQKRDPAVAHVLRLKLAHARSVVNAQHGACRVQLLRSIFAVADPGHFTVCGEFRTGDLKELADLLCQGETVVKCLQLLFRQHGIAS